MTLEIFLTMTELKYGTLQRHKRYRQVQPLALALGALNRRPYRGTTATAMAQLLAPRSASAYCLIFTIPYSGRMHTSQQT